MDVPDPTREPTITPRRAAALLRISENTAYKAIAAGEIPAVRIGRRYFVLTAPLLELLGQSAA